jgi:Holliday junction resolvasome RuvABC endonuclease subunit
MKILAIDPGTHCGWALRLDDGSIFSGVWDLKPSRFEGGGMRWLRLRGFLDRFTGRQMPGLVAFEEVRHHAGVDAAHIYGGIIATLQAWCESSGVPYTSIPVATIKKAATGKGNAKKDAMITAARERWPQQGIADDNQADALWILEVAHRQHGGAA